MLLLLPPLLLAALLLEELDKESAELGFSVPSGAGSKSDQVAARILKRRPRLISELREAAFCKHPKAQKLL